MGETSGASEEDLSSEVWRARGAGNAGQARLAKKF
jgi:hypothetical protein